MKATRFPRHLRHGNVRLTDETTRPRYTPTKLDGPVFTEAAMNQWKAQQTTLIRPFRNGRRDPVTIALVLDLLLRMEHDKIVRTTETVALLRYHYPQASWDVTTVGRILSELADIAADSGAGRPYPLEKDEDATGCKIYAVHVTPANWQWLGKIRHAMGRKAATILEEEPRRGGKRLPWNASPYDGIDTSFQP
jgi:hypothetical protein